MKNIILLVIGLSTSSLFFFLITLSYINSQNNNFENLPSYDNEANNNFSDYYELSHGSVEEVEFVEGEVSSEITETLICLSCLNISDINIRIGQIVEEGYIFFEGKSVDYISYVSNVDFDNKEVTIISLEDYVINIEFKIEDTPKIGEEYILSYNDKEYKFVIGFIDYEIIGDNYVTAELKTKEIYEDLNGNLLINQNITMSRVVKSRENTVIVPIEYISISSGEYYIHKYEDHMIYKIKVSIGLKGVEVYEIVSNNITVGDKIVYESYYRT